MHVRGQCEWMRFAFVCLLLYWLILSFIAQSFKFNSQSSIVYCISCGTTAFSIGRLLSRDAPAWNESFE